MLDRKKKKHQIEKHVYLKKSIHLELVSWHLAFRTALLVFPHTQHLAPTMDF